MELCIQHTPKAKAGLRNSLEGRCIESCTSFDGGGEGMEFTGADHATGALDGVSFAPDCGEIAGDGGFFHAGEALFDVGETHVIEFAKLGGRDGGGERVEDGFVEDGFV